VRADETRDTGLTSGGVGLPVGVQVIGRSGRDDVVLDVMEQLERSFRERPGYPATPPEPSAPEEPGKR
jgi:Asp-tRNA(Asn)/Glu-tRNA(Gln) amidotransferase A subunit family amidase